MPELSLRIDRLTDANRARLGEWRDAWVRVALSTAPADRPRFEASVADRYRAIGLAPPKRVVWVESPLVLSLAAPVAALLLASREQLSVDQAIAGHVWTRLAEALVPLHARLGAEIAREVLAEIRSAVGDPVDEAGGAVDLAIDEAIDEATKPSMFGVYYQMPDPVNAAVRAAVGGATASEIDATLEGASGGGWARLYGCRFAGQLRSDEAAFWTFLLDVCGVRLDSADEAHIRAVVGTSSSACWWWPHRDFVVVSDRPQQVAPGAVVFRDGWRVAGG